MRKLNPVLHLASTRVRDHMSARDRQPATANNDGEQRWRTTLANNDREQRWRTTMANNDGD
jgi:hypothetical protein